MRFYLKRSFVFFCSSVLTSVIFSGYFPILIVLKPEDVSAKLLEKHLSQGYPLCDEEKLPGQASKLKVHQHLAKGAGVWSRRTLSMCCSLASYSNAKVCHEDAIYICLYLHLSIHIST